MKNILSLLLILTPALTCSEIVFKSPDDMLEFVKNILPVNPVILEAGGHHGEDTNRMKSVWQNATMHVFEPLPSSFKKLQESTQNLSDVALYSYALSDYTGKVNFYLNPNNDGASSIGYPVEWNKHEFNETPIEVPCITLNNWVDKYNISHVDFMWLDMEGHELYALQNASKILDTVKAIYTEVGFVHLRENSCLYLDLKKFLEEQGFCEVWKRNLGKFGDALFIKKN